MKHFFLKKMFLSNIYTFSFNKTLNKILNKILV